MVWSTEMATRLRMVGESVEGGLVSRALALDTMSNSGARLIGPIAAGIIYQHFGIAGSYAVSAGVYALAASITRGVSYRQQSRPFVVGNVPRDLAEGVAFARAHITIAGVLAVTIAMNLLAFPYSALVAPIGRQVFMVSPTLVGILAASEAFGAFIGGIFLTSGEPRWTGRVLMVGGSLMFIACVFLMPLAPVFALASGLLAIGGFGSAAFANMQTSLIVLHAPAHIRSRLMGLLTVCIGMGPLGILMLGFLADRVGPMRAIDISETICFLWVVWIGLRWRRRDRVG
jgi:MFS family permease